jgi:endonuclease/exonuclease/phosphatase family metal-dependent hydrolase
MPFYNDLRPTADFDDRDFALVFPDLADTEKKRPIDGLLRIKDALAAQVPSRKAEENLLVASWNIKEFGHTTQRIPESYFYIAEIISRFDLVAVQEVKSTLKDLDIVMRLLGSQWDYLVNDITDGTDGNSERSAYLYNCDRVDLGGLGGEIVLWDDLTAGSTVKQLKRTPYITGFKAGWKTFAMINLHLHPGHDDEDVARRKEEVRLLLAALQEKVDRKRLWTTNLVLTGDFNLYSGDDDETVALINDAGFTEVDALIGKDTNASQTQAYDRFFVRKSDYFRLAIDDAGEEIGGVFDPFDHVLRVDDRQSYKSAMKAVYGGSSDLDVDDNLRSYFLNYWRKNQLSDHFPIWFELEIDSSRSFLEDKRDQLDNS